MIIKFTYHGFESKMLILASLLLGIGMTLLALTLAIFYIVIVVMGAGGLAAMVDELFGKVRQRKKVIGA
jgi:hypothetical protein